MVVASLVLGGRGQTAGALLQGEAFLFVLQVGIVTAWENEKDPLAYPGSLPPVVNNVHGPPLFSTFLKPSCLWERRSPPWGKVIIGMKG